MNGHLRTVVLPDTLFFKEDLTLTFRSKLYTFIKLDNSREQIVFGGARYADFRGENNSIIVGRYTP
jgi:hypothetical protein